MWRFHAAGMDAAGGAVRIGPKANGGSDKMKHNWLFAQAIIAATALVLVMPAAHAQDSQPLALIWFQQIDTDGDDAISGSELDDMRTRRFVQIDLDRDRALTRAEFMQDLSNGETELIERREKRFALMDRDGNGTVDVVEYIGFGAAVMNLLDADHDGYIRRAEFAQAVAAPE